MPFWILLAVDSYLTLGYVPGPRTIFKGINALLPGQRILWSQGVLEVCHYWQPTFLEPILSNKESELVDELDGLLNESVRHHLISDVPVGAFLSAALIPVSSQRSRKNITGNLLKPSPSDSQKAETSASMREPSPSMWARNTMKNSRGLIWPNGCLDSCGTWNSLCSTTQFFQRFSCLNSRAGTVKSCSPGMEEMSVLPDMIGPVFL